VKKFVLMLPLLLLLGAAARADMDAVKVTMRDSGYTMGDFLHMRVEIPLEPGQKLDEESLPLTGRSRYWLDLSDLRWHQAGDTLTLDLSWQLFATVEIAQKLQTPVIPLRTQDGRALQIPAQDFHYSPVLPYPLESSGRRANLPPFKADEQTPLMVAAVCLALSLLSIFVWLWLHDRLPWWPRRPGPMTLLARALRRQPADAVLNRDQLRLIHDALNRSAGQSLYPQTLARLFAVAPYLQPEQPSIAAFFERSWRTFHADVPPTLRADEVQPWVVRCARNERLYWRAQRGRGKA